MSDSDYPQGTRNPDVDDLLSRTRALTLASRRILAFLLLAIPALASADLLEVVRPARIKEGPSKTAAILERPAIGLLLERAPGAETNGYLPVLIPVTNQPGWIYKTLVAPHQAAAAPPAPAAQGTLEVQVMNVGQADATLIKCPDGDHQLLIDAADNRYKGSGKAFKAYMQAHQDQHDRIEVVVASHPHADHIGNMAWLLKNYAVGLYVDDGMDYSETATWRGVEKAFEASTAEYGSAQAEPLPDIDFCTRADVSARIVHWPKFGSYDDANDNSVVVRVEHGGKCLLFVGDLEGTAESDLLADATARSLVRCDFLKVGHHGSNTSSSQAFLDAVNPRIASISCGAKGVSTNDGYKHPRAETITRLLTFVAPVSQALLPVTAYATPQTASDPGSWQSIARPGAVYVTVVDGDLLFLSDGQGIRRSP